MSPTVAYPPVDARLLDEIVMRICRAGNPIRIVLFGSHARRQAGPSSADRDCRMGQSAEFVHFDCSA